jgi:hypothetical protein
LKIGGMAVQNNDWKFTFLASYKYAGWEIACDHDRIVRQTYTLFVLFPLF